MPLNSTRTMDQPLIHLSQSHTPNHLQSSYFNLTHSSPTPPLIPTSVANLANLSGSDPTTAHPLTINVANLNSPPPIRTTTTVQTNLHTYTSEASGPTTSQTIPQTNTAAPHPLLTVNITPSPTSSNHANRSPASNTSDHSTNAAASPSPTPPHRVGIRNTNESPTSKLASSSSTSSMTPGLTARERMAARLAASKEGSFAISRAAYDAAIKSGATPDQAQKAADEAVVANAIATGKPVPIRAVSEPEEEPPPRPPAFRMALSELASPTSSSTTATALSSPLSQQPNAVPEVLHKTTRTTSSSNAISSSSSNTPHLPGLTAEQWERRDAQFMESMCYGVASAQGERAYMEDEHLVFMQFDRLIRLCNPLPTPPAATVAASTISSSANSTAASSSTAITSGSIDPTSPSSDHPHRGHQAFFGVYDGHGGREAAEFVRDHLHINIAKRMRNPTGNQSPIDLGEAMKLGAADTESALLLQSIDRQSAAGAVIAFTIFSGMQVYVAHAGDARAVLCREGVAMDLTQDHKPGLESEQGRVAALGGFISDGCVNGEIAVSRALGDVNLETGRKMLGLSADVALSKFYLTDEDEFVIIACDGLWDVMNSAAAVSYARHQLQQHNDIQRCAGELVQQALRQQSTDNVSVIVIGFTRTRGSENGEPTIVPPNETRSRSINRSHQPRPAPPPPRPSRLANLNLNKLMDALEIDEQQRQQAQNRHEEEEEDEEEEDER